jgi:hypothetical protein
MESRKGVSHSSVVLFQPDRIFTAVRPQLLAPIDQQTIEMVSSLLPMKGRSGFDEGVHQSEFLIDDKSNS